MNTNQKNIGIGFWLTWVLASTVGFGLGSVLGSAILIFARVPDPPSFPILFGAIFGVIGTLPQWQVIRRWTPEAGLWIPLSAVTSALAVGTTASMASSLSPDFNPFLIIAGIYGLLGGFLQGLILEKHGVPIVGWIIVSLLGGLLGCMMNGSAVATVETSAAWQPGMMEFFWIWFRIGAPFGLGLGLTTGAALVWFLRNSKPRPIADIARQSAP